MFEDDQNNPNAQPGTPPNLPFADVPLPPKPIPEAQPQPEREVPQVPPAPDAAPATEDIFAQTDTSSSHVSTPTVANYNPAPPAIDEAEIFGGRELGPRRMIVTVGIVFLTLLIIAAVALGAVYLWKNLKTMASYKSGGSANSQDQKNPKQSAPAGNSSSQASSGTSTDTVVPERRDSDGDGLYDDEEKASNTNINDFDTDHDGLSDRAEVKLFKTDPNKPDTDGDGYNDGAEVINGYDPSQPGNTRLFEVPKE